MANSQKIVVFWFIFSLLVVAVVIYPVGKGGLLEKVRSHIRSDLVTANAKLVAENEKFKDKIDLLQKQILLLEKALVSQTIQFSALDDAAPDTKASKNIYSMDPLENLDQESFLNQQIYRALRAERKRWDGYQQIQYQDIL